MTDWKARCAELMATLETHYPAETQGHYFTADLCDVLTRTRAELAQPEPQGLTDEPLGDLIDKWVQEAFRKKPYGCKHPTHTYVACKAFQHGRDHAARTALAQPEPEGPTDQDMDDLADDMLGVVLPEGSGARLIKRALELWGRPAIEPVPEPDGLSDEAIDEIYWNESWRAGAEDQSAVNEVGLAEFRLIARAVHARFGRPAVQPVPVSDRWPEFSDCDQCERVWVWNPILEHWKLTRLNRSIHTHWLPHWALPVPTSEPEVKP